MHVSSAIRPHHWEHRAVECLCGVLRIEPGVGPLLSTGSIVELIAVVAACRDLIKDRRIVVCVDRFDGFEQTRSLCPSSTTSEAARLRDCVDDEVGPSIARRPAIGAVMTSTVLALEHPGLGRFIREDCQQLQRLANDVGDDIVPKYSSGSGSSDYTLHHSMVRGVGQISVLREVERHLSEGCFGDDLLSSRAGGIEKGEGRSRLRCDDRRNVLVHERLNIGSRSLLHLWLLGVGRRRHRGAGRRKTVAKCRTFGFRDTL